MWIRSRHFGFATALLFAAVPLACGGVSSEATPEPTSSSASGSRASAANTGPSSTGADPGPRPAGQPTGREARIGGPARVHRWDFEQTREAALPAGFTASVGRWQTRELADAPSGTRVLEQRAASRGAVFNVLLGEPAPADLDVTVRLQAISGDIDRGGGLIWRAQGPEDYYVARYNPLEDNFRLYTVVHGHRSMLESATVHVDHDTWHTMRVVMRGPSIVCYLDGESHLEASDETFTGPGRVGLWTKADAVTRFDDLTVATP